MALPLPGSQPPNPVVIPNVCLAFHTPHPDSAYRMSCKFFLRSLSPSTAVTLVQVSNIFHPDQGSENFSCKGPDSKRLCLWGSLQSSCNHSTWLCSLESDRDKEHPSPQHGFLPTCNDCPPPPTTLTDFSQPCSEIIQNSFPVGTLQKRLDWELGDLDHPLCLVLGEVVPGSEHHVPHRCSEEVGTSMCQALSSLCHL